MKRKTLARRKTGRPLVHVIELPYYDSMKAMSAATGIPISALKYAKDNGCLFERHHRYDLGVFLKWFFARKTEPGDESTDWGLDQKRTKALLQRIELARQEELVIDFSAADRFIKKLIGSVMFGQLDKLAHELPPDLKGLGEVRIHETLIKRIETIKKKMKHDFESWKERGAFEE